MANERYTESIVLNEMKSKIGKNNFGYIFPQGDISEIDKIQKLLEKAGGKPKDCAIDDYSKGGTGKAQPEYIITFLDDVSTIIVVECKKTVAKHKSLNLDKPKDYAVDGVLYYAKFLKEEFNVIAIAVSGTEISKIKVNSFYWTKNSESYNEIRRAENIILEPENYLALIKGNKLKKEYSLEEIRMTAINMHNYLREIKVNEIHKPIFIAGILIALSDDDFLKSYLSLKSYDLIIKNIQIAIENVLKNSDIKSSRIDYIKQVFQTLLENTKFSEIPLGHFKSITWYIEQLEMKIKPMMDYADSTVDALGVFYHEFIKYSGGDGKGLGIVLTPQHLTEFMCEITNVGKKSKVVDICCGSGSFLVTAMSKMFSKANQNEIEDIKKKNLYGVEFDDGLYTLAIANMIIRKDGKSNIFKGDCFNKGIVKELKKENINIGLINPPYSQKDVSELEFTEQLLDILTVGGTGAVVVPMACAIGTKFKEVRERLFNKHTLKAVFSMPDEIFYPTATNVCVMIWEAHVPHDSNYETFFGYFKDDGFEKRKYIGRVDYKEKWNKIKEEWLKLYKNREIKTGLSAKSCVNYDDEWLCEAYMETDFSILDDNIFKQTIQDYLAFQIKNGLTDLNKKHEIKDNKIELSNMKWGEFKIEEIFPIIERGKITNLNDLPTGNCPIVSAYGENQGVSFFADEEIKYKNCLTASMNGSKTGYITYHGYGFNANSDCGILKSNYELNIYTGLFIATVMKQFSFKYIYGRKLTGARLKNEIIKLPINNKNEIDFKIMEEYIKSLPYSNIL